MQRYRAVLGRRDFGLLFGGATVSIVGDGMTLVALLWMVYQRTGSALDLGWMTFAYTAPVVVGGLLAGMALDRFGPRRVLILDSLGRGVVMASVPVLHLLGALPTWYLFVAAAAYGLLKMIPLAGVPAIIPDLVDGEELTTANALESIAYGVGGIIGPALAGVLIGVIGAELVVGIDAATYFVFVGSLILMRGGDMRADEDGDAAEHEPMRTGMRQALGVVLGTPAILAITVMFMASNAGEGGFMVALPIYADQVLRAGASGYGWLLAAFSAGLLAGAVVVGSRATPTRLGRSVALALLLSGGLLLGFLATRSLPAAVGLGLAVGLAGSPLTIWAQTLRMQLIPPRLRGRVFALLRTLMQATPPLGGLLGGVLLEASGIEAVLVAAAALSVVPGLVGLVHPALAGRAPTLGGAMGVRPAEAPRRSG